MTESAISQSNGALFIGNHGADEAFECVIAVSIAFPARHALTEITRARR
jgi:hypothetical protein